MKTLQKMMVTMVMVALLAACSSDPASNDKDEVVNIPDALLLVQIKNALELGETDEVTVSKMLDLTELNISTADFRAIADLTGLEYAVNLTFLHFGQTAVTDLSPISGLRKIEYLRMNGTAVTDLSPIAEFTSLTYFNANTATGITDISPLAGNAGLQEAILREVPFGNAGMSTLKEFPVIYRLNMRDTGVTDVTILGEVMASGALQNSTAGAEANGGASLDLRGLSIEDWSPIEPYVGNIANLSGYSGN